MRRVLTFILFGGGAFFLFEGSSSFLAQFRPSTALTGETLDNRLRISFPRIGSQLSVSPSAGKNALLHGPGLLAGAGQPGEPGNLIIAGHRDTHFRLLKDIRTGDEIRIEKGWKEYRYRVIETKVVAPAERSVLASSPEPLLTLVTCYPFNYVGPAPKRFIVRAVLTASVTHSAASSGPDWHFRMRPIQDLTE